MAVAVFLTLLGVIGAFFCAMRPLYRPLAEVVGQAERISKGDFAAPLDLRRSDELGDIACALERMRASLRAVAARLEGLQVIRRSNE